VEENRRDHPSEQVLYVQSDLSEPEEIPYDRFDLSLEEALYVQSDLSEPVGLVYILAVEESPVRSDLPEQVAFEEVPCLTDLSGSARLAYILAAEELLSHSDLPPQVEKMRPVCFDLLEPEYLCLTGLLAKKASLPIYCFGQLAQEVVSLIFGQLVFLLPLGE
tara:strand:+ start:16769 stop:17257 length:489 start_codon:yes stop_codon:yes gene_type:complete